MRSYNFLILFIFCVPVHAKWFAHDRAAVALQQGNLDQAKELLQAQLIEDPENYDLLYDAGYAWYKSKNYEQAANYFNRAAQASGLSDAKKEQALFNLGNAQVESFFAQSEKKDTKLLEQALENYRNVLTINSDNKGAQHNKQKVEELLKQQQQQQKEQEQNQDKQDKDKQKKQDQKNGSDQSDQNEQQDQNDQKNQDQKKEGKNKKSKTGADQRQQPDQHGGDQKEKEQEKTPEQKPQDGHQRKEQEQGKQQEEKEETAQEQNGGKQDKKEQKQDKEHGNDSNKNEENNTNKKDTQDLAKGQQELADFEKNAQEQEKKLDVQLRKVLQAQEKKDAALNKKMIKMTVNKGMSGNDGQNCW